MGSRGRYRRVKWKVKLIVILILTIFLVAYTEAGIRSTIRQVSQTQIQILGTELINAAVSETIADTAISYDELSHIRYSAGESVSSVEVNTLEINRLRTQITQTILKDIQSLKNIELQIPLGTLLQHAWLSARGPKVGFQVYPRGYLNSKIVSEFDSAGINQTRHRIVLQLAMEMEAVFPFYHHATMVTSEFVMAETIIVGEIPQYYTKVVSEDDELISKINDYGSQNNPITKPE